MTETLTDISGLVDSAFDELECICNDGQGPHDGGKVGYYQSHANKKCLEGWICEAHFRYYVDVYRPSVQETLRRDGYVKCVDCHEACYSVDDFCKVVTL